MCEAEAIQEIAYQILEDNPDPAVRFRLLRDVLQLSPVAESLQKSKQNLYRSNWVDSLQNEQREDGGWERFHSRDSQLRQQIPTTEAAIDRAINLGVEGDHPLIQKVTGYLADLLANEIPFPDPPEKNDRWSTGTNLFVAGSLSRLKPGHPGLENAKQLWTDIAVRTFHGGYYDPDAELKAHAELTGASVRDSYLVLNNKYAITLLSACRDRLEESFYIRFLNWLMQLPSGIGYFGVNLGELTSLPRPGTLDRWLSSWELLLIIPGAHLKGEHVASWLWHQRKESGLWDLGSRWPPSTFFPLSQDWRSPKRRIHDHSTRALLLLRKICAST